MCAEFENSSLIDVIYTIFAILAIFLVKKKNSD